MKKIIIIALIVILVFCTVSMTVSIIVYNNSFPAYPRHDETITASLRYSDISNEYPREKVDFLSKGNTLQGYIYGKDNNTGLLILSHGIGGGADSYLPQIKYFVDKGWRVFAYDATGSFDSEGKSTKGFPQAIYDLDAALRYVDSQSTFNGLPIVLFGHSWGGYANTCILAFDHDIKGVVSIAGANSAMEMIIEQGHRMMGGFIYTQYPFLWLYQQILFSDTASLRADDAIADSNTPVMIIHGVNDEMVSYDGSSIISKNKLKDIPEVVTFTLDEEGRNGHNNMFRSKKAVEYIDEVNKMYRTIYDSYEGEIPYEKKQEIYSGIDRFLAQDLDAEFMDMINDFYLECIEK